MALSRYDFDDKIIAALRNREGVGTVGEISADTGIGYHDCERSMRHLLTIYKSHLDVDDDGNLLYQFDEGFVRRGEDSGRFWHNAKKTAWAGFKMFFKVWIMVMLVGYVSVFVLLLIALAVGAIGASASSDSDSGLGELITIPFHLLARLLEFMFWIDFYGKSGRGGRRGMRPVRKREKISKPFYQKTFDFVFGPEKEVDTLAIHRKFTEFIRANDGQITAADWARISGQSLDKAETALTASVVRYNGEVDYTENGTLVYKFRELLLASSDSEVKSLRVPKTYWSSEAKVPKLTGNPKGTNRWIVGLNAFILIASSVVLGTAGLPAAAVIGLGAIPLVFSLIFFSVPIFRWIKQQSLKGKVAAENKRRKSVKKIFDSVKSQRPVSVEPAVALDFGGEYDEEIDAFRFDALATQLEDGQEARASNSVHDTFGASVFSSNDETKTVSDFEMEEFDKRLAEELGVPMEESVGVNAEVHAY